jgi:TonB family protein
MESQDHKTSLLKLLVEHDPASPEFRNGVRAALSTEKSPVETQLETKVETKDDINRGNADFNLWRDVFVERPLPWRRFLQSAALHLGAVALIWTISLSWIRQQKILDRNAFDRSSLVTYTPQEYLPPLDTGRPKAQKAQKGDPVYAKQPILSVPQEADNRAQTIVAPPDIKLNHDVPMPNIVASGAILPQVPLDATRPSKSRLVAPETQVVAPAPEVQFSPDRVVRTAMKTDVVAPPPDLTQRQSRGLSGPETAVVAPPPELKSTHGHAGMMNIGPSQVVAPAPQLTLDEQHARTARGTGRLPGGGVQPVGPPPSVAAGGNAGGRMVALGIHPVAAAGPVAVPAGNRRGSFSASPQGKAGAAGTPDLAESKSDAKGTAGRNGSSLPSGLHVGAGKTGSGNSGDGTREVASVTPPGNPAHLKGRVASPVSDDKITDVDRQVFGGKRPYSMSLNLPNLNSSSGSWEIRFAELSGGRKDGELLAPLATEQSDPGYPLELIKANVHGTVTLYAVIQADGRVGEIRVLNSPDERLDGYAAKALARWKFMPAERAGKPVALEAVVKIPFRVRRNF